MGKLRRRRTLTHIILIRIHIIPIHIRITPTMHITAGRVFGGPLAGGGMAADGIGDGVGVGTADRSAGMEVGAAGGMAVVASMAASMVEAGTANQLIL